LDAANKSSGRNRIEIPIQPDAYTITSTHIHAQFPEIQIGFFDENARSRPMVCKIFTKAMTFRINCR